MSFLQLVLSLDKTKEGINSILGNMSSWHLDRYRNISLSLNVMFVMSVIAQLVLGGVFCGNQSNCRNCRICRICILIGECWNGVDSLEILEHCRIAWKAGRLWMTGMSWMSLEQLELPGMSCKIHGCISRRSPCLLCVEFLELDCSTRRALCLLHVEFSVLCTCRIGAGIGAWRIL